MSAETIGYAAGLTTSLLWTFTSLFFTSAARLFGTTAVNSVRLGAAFLLHLVVHRCLTGVWLPETTTAQVLYLGLSGILGLSIGDQALLTAFVDIGPRQAMLVMTTAPLLAALFGWLVLSETMSWVSLLGISLTVSGVGWVVFERPTNVHPAHPSFRVRGMILALIAAACQAAGLMLSKKGMGHGWLPVDEHMPPQTATMIRMTFGGLGMIPILFLDSLRQRLRASVSAEQSSEARRFPVMGILLSLGGAVTGPFLGVWMSLVASDRVPVGVAQTLCSLPPVLILPFAALVYQERIGFRAVAAALVAVAGLGVLFAGA